MQLIDSKNRNTIASLAKFFVPKYENGIRYNSATPMEKWYDAFLKEYKFEIDPMRESFYEHANCFIINFKDGSSIRYRYYNGDIAEI